jgi:hypothetical protein
VYHYDTVFEMTVLEFDYQVIDTRAKNVVIDRKQALQQRKKAEKYYIK